MPARAFSVARKTDSRRGSQDVAARTQQTDVGRPLYQRRAGTVDGRDCMNPRRTFAIVLRQLYLMRGNPARVLPLFAWVCIDIVLWGFITKYFNSVLNASVDLIP